jgi:photosynthetic reaction center cytochrome c subunit
MSVRNVSLAILLAGASVSLGCDRPPIEATQNGYRGMGLAQLSNPRDRAADSPVNRPPTPAPPLALEGPPAGQALRNVTVLGDVPLAQFMRLMAGMTEWVSPNEGCVYCHDSADLAADSPYQKKVARHMVEMVRDINTNWKPHVGETGVTCYTCHRGMHVPDAKWSFDVGGRKAGLAAYDAGQNAPSIPVGLTSLPRDPLKDYLADDANIRVQSMTALPDGNRSSIKQAERTYAFMFHISKSLGVNCGYCHNTNSFIQWTQPRATAWHAIRMVRHLNEDYLEPLSDVLPAHRKGPAGDVYKVNCETCHRGQAKPLGGLGMAADYPELLGPIPPPSEPAAVPAADPTATPAAESTES